MKARDWLDSLTKEQLDSYYLLGSGFWPSIMMKILEENDFKVGVQSRYDFADNMLGAER